MFDKMLKGNNYFEIETSTKYKILSDIDYNSNYDEIFKNNDLELDK